MWQRFKTWGGGCRPYFYIKCSTWNIPERGETHDKGRC
nr:MAG TPA_asm: hypothetical protein [Bacteriophage sp.]